MSSELVYIVIRNFVSRTMENGVKLDNIVKKTGYRKEKQDIVMMSKTPSVS